MARAPRARADLWDLEIARAADGAEIPVERLAALFQDTEAAGAPAPWSEAEILKVVGRLLVLAAEELEGAADEEARLDAARGGLLGLAQVALLLEVPRLSDWSARLAESDELTELATDAARMLRGEAFEMGFTQSLAELRACAWRWPERREKKLPESEIVPEPQPELEVTPVVMAEAAPEPITEETEPEPAPKPAPPPPPVRPAPRRRFVERALVADPSAIAAGFLARLLMSRGVQVTMAETAERTAAEIASGGYDVVFAVHEWATTAAPGETWIVRLLPEGGNATAGLGERVLFKPPAAEEVNQILEAWAGRVAPH